MPILSARVSPETRSEIDKLSTRWSLGNAETLRRLVVLGLGGTLHEANAVNAAMRQRRDAAEAYFGKRKPGYREHPGRDRTPFVGVRLPSLWAARVKGRLGGLKSVLEAGLEKI